MQLAESTWTEIRDTNTDLAFLPVGSTEQHGPHAPLGVDSMTAAAIAETAAERFAATYDVEPVVGPTIPVGLAEEHRHFAGTLWVSPDTFRAYIHDTLESLAHHGLTKIVIVNGHGGNTGALREVCAQVTRDDIAYAVTFTWFDAVPPEDLGHGGLAETGVIRHLRPDLIRDDRLADATMDGAETWGEWLHGTNLVFDSADFTDSGVVGDPRESDPARGETLLDESAAAAADILAAINDRSA